MSTWHHDALPRGINALVAAFSLCVLVFGLSGCTSSAADSLPSSHVEQGEVATDHARCGACHRNGTRGNEVYTTIDPKAMESLSHSGVDAIPDPPEGTATESLYADQNAGNAQ